MMPTMLISDTEKGELWKQYHAGKPSRVPMMTYSNPRVVVLNRSWNPEGYTFKQAEEDPKIHLELSLRHQLYRRTVINRYADEPTGLPEVWHAEMWVYNVYEAAYFGAPVCYPQGDVPCTEPLPAGTDKRSVLAVDIEKPLENPFVKHWLNFHARMKQAAEGMKFEGRPVKVANWSLNGTDGPLTGGCNLFGSDFLLDLYDDPEFAQKFLAFYVKAAILRRRAFWELWNNKDVAWNGMADDSCALISPEDFRSLVLPHHLMFYNSFDEEPRARNGVQRRMHMCGDATRHYATLVRHAGVKHFDTGFPVDFGWLRKEVGSEVEIMGGPEVAILLNGSPTQVYERTRDILQSGIKEGGRFLLRDGNNLPPNVPDANLEAMYAACLEFGRYE